MLRQAPARCVKLRLGWCWLVDPASVPACSEHSQHVMGSSGAQKGSFGGQEESACPSTLEMPWGKGSQVGLLSWGPLGEDDGQDMPEGCPGAGFCPGPVFLQPRVTQSCEGGS